MCGGWGGARGGAGSFSPGAAPGGLAPVKARVSVLARSPAVGPGGGIVARAAGARGGIGVFKHPTSAHDARSARASVRRGRTGATVALLGRSGRRPPAPRGRTAAAGRNRRCRCDCVLCETMSPSVSRRFSCASGDQGPDLSQSRRGTARGGEGASAEARGTQSLSSATGPRGGVSSSRSISATRCSRSEQRASVAARALRSAPISRAMASSCVASSERSFLRRGMVMVRTDRGTALAPSP
jgi:hypothetical protein